MGASFPPYRRKLRIHDNCGEFMKKNISFEEALASLEEIVKKMEYGELTLDESISSFEEAIKLVKICNEKIESAEQKVRILTEREDGSITDAPFIESNET